MWRPLPAALAAPRGRGAALGSGQGRWGPAVPRVRSPPWEPLAAPGTAPRGAAFSGHRTGRPSEARAAALSVPASHGQCTAGNAPPPRHKRRPQGLPALRFYFRLHRDSYRNKTLKTWRRVPAFQRSAPACGLALSEDTSCAHILNIQDIPETVYRIFKSLIRLLSTFKKSAVL